MKKYLVYAFALTALTFAACSDDDDDNKKEDVIVPSTSAVVLNTGNWNGNDASIMRYDLVNHQTTSDLYLQANNENLGDLGQDIIKYGSKYYVTVTGSSKVVILDEGFKIIKTIPFVANDSASTPTQPRYMAAANGKVYVTAYDSKITRIDTTSLTITGSVEVGDHPEGISYANGKLYANISGYGSGSTVAVVNETTLTKIKDIDVVLNPYTQSVVAGDGNVYIVSNGNYAGASWLTEEQYVYATVQCINTATDEVTTVCNGTYIAAYGNKLYVLYSEYYLPARAKAFVYDLDTKEETTLTDLSQYSSLNGIDVDPTTGDVYVYDTPYGSNGLICGPIRADGTPAYKVQAGYYTCKMLFE